MEIRKGTVADLEAIARVEARCFPPEQAATREQFRDRLEIYPEGFWLLWDGDTLVSVLDGMCSDSRELTDEMFAWADLHDPGGAWQMIFGLNTIPEYRNRGCAGMLIRECIDDAGRNGRRGVVLTCLEEKIPYYEKFGFRNEGESASVHGGAVWYQMRLEFADTK